MQLDERQLPADAYNLFERLMRFVKPWYLPEQEVDTPDVITVKLRKC